MMPLTGASPEADGPGPPNELGDTHRVEVIIAVHQQSRPVERAVSSVLAHAPVGTRAVVVCHNLAAEIVAARLPPAMADRIDLITLHDGIPSAAGPFNRGLDRSRATFVSLMGSDDYLQPGALEAWVRLAESRGLDAVMARVEHQAGGLVRTPPTRWGRRSEHLELTLDRLAYRTAPLGLIRRAALSEQRLRLQTRLATGEDLELGLRLWHGAGTAYAASAPAYVVGADAQERVTTSRRPIGLDLECCTRLVSGQWFTGLTAAERCAIVVKLVRIHVFGAVANRRDRPGWERSERTELAASTETILAGAPKIRAYLSIAEGRLLRAVLDPATDDRQLRHLSERRVRHGRWDTVLTANPRGLLARQGPGRLMAASLLMR